jgi:hypothetical protein
MKHPMELPVTLQVTFFFNIFEVKDWFLGLIVFVIAQVVGWEKPDPTTKMATTLGHYTQCHLDVGPTLQG